MSEKYIPILRKTVRPARLRESGEILTAIEYKLKEIDLELLRLLQLKANLEKERQFHVNITAARRAAEKIECRLEDCCCKRYRVSISASIDKCEDQYTLFDINGNMCMHNIITDCDCK